MMYDPFSVLLDLSSVLFRLSRVWLFATSLDAAHHTSLSITIPGTYSKSGPLTRWCHPTISCSVFPFNSCLQSFPASGSFQMSQLFSSGGQRIGVSASISVPPMNIQGWFPLGWTGWIILQSKGLSVFFIVQLSHPCITTGKTTALTRWTLVGKIISLIVCCLSWI